MPTDLILSAVTPNGMNLTQDFLDTAVYVKGDRQDSAQIQDMYLDIEYIDNVIGAVQTVSDLTEVEQTIGYEMGAVFSNPVVFASPLSYDGPEAASVAFSSITSHGVTLYVDEADYHDGIHRWPDDVSLLTLQEGSWQLEDGTRLEVGTEIFSAGPTNTFHSVVFDWAFENVPTVLVQLQTQNDPTWAVLRTDNISTSGFDFLLQHEEANSGLEHGEEIVGWMAIDTASPSGLVDWGTVLGQDFSLPTVVDHTGFEFTFDSALGSDPIIAAHISSFYGPNTANLRLVDVTADSFAATAEFLVKEESSLDAEQWHVLEDLNGLAFSGAGILQGEAIVDDFLIA